MVTQLSHELSRNGGTMKKTYRNTLVAFCFLLISSGASASQLLVQAVGNNMRLQVITVPGTDTASKKHYSIGDSLRVPIVQLSTGTRTYVNTTGVVINGAIAMPDGSVLAASSNSLLNFSNNDGRYSQQNGKYTVSGVEYTLTYTAAL